MIDKKAIYIRDCDGARCLGDSLEPTLHTYTICPCEVTEAPKKDVKEKVEEVAKKVKKTVKKAVKRVTKKKTTKKK